MHTVIGGYTPGNISFLVMNPDFHFVLAMDVIMCTTGVGNVLRTSVCMSTTVSEVDMLWSGLEFVIWSHSAQNCSRNIEYRKIQTIFLILSFCPFCNSETLITSFNMTMQDVTWLVFVKAF